MTPQPDRFTVLTLTVRFTLPITTPDAVASGVNDQLREYAEVMIEEGAIDAHLSEYLAGTEENPNTPVGRALDIEVLKVEVTVE